MTSISKEFVYNLPEKSCNKLLQTLEMNTNVWQINKGFCLLKVTEVIQPMDDSSTYKIEQMTISLAWQITQYIRTWRMWLHISAKFIWWQQSLCTLSGFLVPNTLNRYLENYLKSTENFSCAKKGKIKYKR